MSESRPSQEELERIYINNFDSASSKYNEGKIAELTEDEKTALEYHKFLQQQNDPSRLTDKEKERRRFESKTKEFSEDGGKRVIHITDTEASPDDLEHIIKRNLDLSGFKKGKDVMVHTGDLLEDFINFKAIQGGDTSSFLKENIISKGGLEGKVADEFEAIYDSLLESHGISEESLVEGKIDENFVRALQNLYHGGLPNFLNKDETIEYKSRFMEFSKHLKNAIKHDARTKYMAYKEKFENSNLSPEDLILIEGNHDVPDVMREILGEYMPAPGGVIKRNGITFGNPLTGSTGQHLGPEFIDTFGYTDLKEQLEQKKYSTSGFQKLLGRLQGELGMDHIDEKDLSRLIMMSQQKASQGIGEGDLAKYFKEHIQGDLDNSIQEMRGQMVNRIPQGVDFYLMHGQPNGPHKGLEEEAFLTQLEKMGGGQILHGHEHGKSSHLYGKSIILNEGEGRSNLGIYHLSSDNKISDIYSQNIDRGTGNPTYEMRNRDSLTVQKPKGGGY